MFDIGWTEIAIIGIIALIVIGPKDLPRVLHTLGKWTAKARGLTREFRGHVDDLIRESELDDVRNKINDFSRTDIREAMEDTVDPNREVREAFEFGDQEYIEGLGGLDAAEKEKDEKAAAPETAADAASMIEDGATNQATDTAEEKKEGIRS